MGERCAKFYISSGIWHSDEAQADCGLFWKHFIVAYSIASSSLNDPLPLYDQTGIDQKIAFVSTKHAKCIIVGIDL